MKKIMLFFAVACIFAACNNDNEVLNETQYITEFKADFGANTRITATPDNGLKFAWEDGDVLYVYQADDASVDKMTFAYSVDTKKFVLADGDGMEVDKQYFAANISTDDVGPFTIENENILFRARLNGLANIPLISDVFTAIADGTIAAMHHTVGVVEVPVKLDAESTITTLTNLSLFHVDGEFPEEFIATPASPYFKEALTAYGTYIWANMGDTELSTTEATSIFIPMVPGVYDDNYRSLKYRFGPYNSLGSSRLRIPFTVECGKVTKLPEQILLLADFE